MVRCGRFYEEAPTPNCVDLNSDLPGYVVHGPSRPDTVASVTFKIEAKRKYFLSRGRTVEGSRLGLEWLGMA